MKELYCLACDRGPCSSRTEPEMISWCGTGDMLYEKVEEGGENNEHETSRKDK